MKKRISVCLASYNGEKFINEQIDSIVSQLSENDELIISDDSSTDNTTKIIEEWAKKDNRIVYYFNQKFKSPIYNFEFCIKQSQGEYIFLSDQDDIWLSNRVARQLEKLQHYDLVYGNCTTIDESRNITNQFFFPYEKPKPTFIGNFIINSYIGATMAFRSDVLNYILPFPKKLAMHDLWIGNMVSIMGSVHYMKDPLILYRRHGNTLTSTGEGSQNSLFFKLKYRIGLLFDILKRLWKVKIY